MSLDIVFTSLKDATMTKEDIERLVGKLVLRCQENSKQAALLHKELQDAGRKLRHFGEKLADKPLETDVPTDLPDLGLLQKHSGELRDLKEQIDSDQECLRKYGIGGPE